MLDKELTAKYIQIMKLKYESSIKNLKTEK